MRSRPVSRVLSWTVIPLGHPSLDGSSNLPGTDAGRAMVPYLVLLPMGFAVPAQFRLFRNAELVKAIDWIREPREEPEDESN